MKKFSLFSKSLLAFMALAVITFTSCGDDPLTPESIPPSVRFADNGAGSLTSDSNVNAGEIFTLNVVSSTGDSPLNTLTIDEDGTNINLDRLSGSTNGGNPSLLSGDDKNGIDWNVTITAPTIPGSYLVTATVADDANESAAASITITIEDTPPTLSLVNTAGMFEVDPGTVVAVKVTAEAGSRRLNTITVWEDGVAMTDLSRIDFMGSAFTENPLTLAELEKDGFAEGEVIIRTVNAEEMHTYSIIVEDEGANAASVDIDINTVIPGTPIAMSIEGVLFNAGGPAGTGGINLLDGSSTGSNAAAAQLHDEGIDTNLAADVNWKKRISGESNGSVVKLVDTSVLPEGFSFATVTTTEEIQGAHDNGNVFTNTNIDGELISWEVEVGDMYTVENGTDLFLIEIVEVNIKPDMGDNSDNYKINIKY